MTTDAGERNTLQVFPSFDAATQKVRRSKVGRSIQAIPSASGVVLKQLGVPSVELTFLCRDGRWRRWDLVAGIEAEIGL